MCEARRVDEPAGADEGAAGVADLGFAVGREWDLADARVAAVEGPFGFAMAGEEDAGGGHCGFGGEGGVLLCGGGGVKVGVNLEKYARWGRGRVRGDVGSQR